MSNTRSNFPLKDYYSDIYKTYDRVNRIFTFGRDQAWRKKAVIECLSNDPANVLDVCTGTGDFILEIARQVSEGVSLTGFDFSSAMLKVANRKHGEMVGRHNIPPVQFVEGDVRYMPFNDGQFDAMGITFGIRNLVYENSHAREHLAEMHRVLDAGGKLVILESAKPANAVWRLINSIYLQFILPYLGGLISGNLKAYNYLAKSSKNYYTLWKMGSIMEDAGFTISKSETLFLGSVMLVVAVKK